MMRPAVLFLTLLSAGGLALVVINIILFDGNRVLQAENAERQRYINDTVRLNQLNAQLIKVAAETAATQGDEQLRALLAENGITFEVTPAPAAAPVEAGEVVDE